MDKIKYLSKNLYVFLPKIKFDLIITFYLSTNVIIINLKYFLKRHHHPTSSQLIYTNYNMLQ